MAKYTIRYNIICPHEIEIDAESVEDAKMKSRSDYYPHSDVLQDFAESFPRDLSNADVEVECIINENGKYIVL